MEQAIAGELEQLQRMPVEQLRARYREVYGEESRSAHKPHLVRGTLEKGKWADIVVYDKNPLDDIRNTETISTVYVAGNEVK